MEILYGINFLKMRNGLKMNEKEYIPLSWLSQMCYCPRRAALLLNERAWVENVETAKGRVEHEHVHTKRIEKRGNFLKLYEYEVVSDKMGLNGKCDCIEATRSEKGCVIPAVNFKVSLFPIEYKHGKVREDELEYKVQLCAEAMCLEEMYQTDIPEGEIFFISSHKRLRIELSEELRAVVRNTVEELKKIRESFFIPSAQYSPKCKRCSMIEYCMPKVKKSAIEYCRKLRKEAEERGEA